MKYLLGLKTEVEELSWLCAKLSTSKDFKDQRSSGRCVKELPERSSSLRLGNNFKKFNEVTEIRL